MSALESPGGVATASVDLLVAEVRVVMVGNRQVTLSVYRQLDWAPLDNFDAWGRVRSNQKPSRYSEIELIGLRRSDGTLARSTSEDENLYEIDMDLWLGTEWANAVRLEHGRRSYGGQSFTAERISIAKQNFRTVFLERPRAGWSSVPSEDLEPQQWRFASEAQRLEVMAAAETVFNEAAEAQRVRAHLERLPLIVLAGLK